MPDARLHDAARRAGFFQDDAERDQRKRGQPVERQQKEEQLAAEKIRVGFGQGRATKQLHVRQFKRLCQISAHEFSLAQRHSLKKVFPSVKQHGTIHA
jgi:hypothetical protein